MKVLAPTGSHVNMDNTKTKKKSCKNLIMHFFQKFKKCLGVLPRGSHNGNVKGSCSIVWRTRRVRAWCASMCACVWFCRWRAGLSMGFVGSPAHGLGSFSRTPSQRETWPVHALQVRLLQESLKRWVGSPAGHSA